jgi:hypothetical protein
LRDVLTVAGPGGGYVATRSSAAGARARRGARRAWLDRAGRGVPEIWILFAEKHGARPLCSRRALGEGERKF